MKFKKNKNIILLSLFLVVFVALIFFVKIFENPFYIKGYKKDEIKMIEALSDSEQESIKKHEYEVKLKDLLKDSRYDKERIDDYLFLLNKYPNYYEDILNYPQYHEEFENYVEAKESIFVTDPYFLIRNYDRYKNYYEKIKDLSFETNQEKIRYVVERVNAKADLKQYDVTYPADISKGNLILVNKYYYLPDNYKPDDLVKYEGRYGDNEEYIRKEVQEQFILLHDDALKEGYFIYAQSSFRDTELQSYLRREYELREGIKSADKHSARVGFSEHQTGMAIDVLAPGSARLSDFENYPAYQWMLEHAHEYGFILRYPEDKEDVTGYIFESWHYRYVGKEVAEYIHEHKITFDEYYEYYVLGEAYEL